MVSETKKIAAGYKQTEIGVIPDDWDVKRLGEIADFVNGMAHEHFISDIGDYIVVNSKFISTCGNVIKYSKYCLCPAPINSVLMVMSDVPNGKAIAKCFFVKQANKYTINQRICILKPKINPKYLFYKINRNPFYLSFDDGVKQTNLKKNEVLSCAIAYPKNKDEQIAIADALSDIDALIEKLGQLIEKKRIIKQGAMQELLTGKRRLPGFSGGWEVKLLPAVSWFQEGPGVRATQFTHAGVKLLNGTNIYKGKLLLDNTDKFISDKLAFGSYAHFLVSEGDILIASSGITIDKFEEKISFAKKENLPLCMNTSTIRFKVKGDNLEALFLFYFLMSKNFKEQIGAQATGSAQLNFGPSHLKKTEIYMPRQKEEQAAIAKILFDVDAEIEKLELQFVKYQNIKQGMMQVLLTGKIRLINK
jgi:type I restriction enzyme S subunit